MIWLELSATTAAPTESSRRMSFIAAANSSVDGGGGCPDSFSDQRRRSSRSRSPSAIVRVVVDRCPEPVKWARPSRLVVEIVKCLHVQQSGSTPAEGLSDPGLRENPLADLCQVFRRRAERRDIHRVPRLGPVFWLIDSHVSPVIWSEVAQCRASRLRGRSSAAGSTGRRTPATSDRQGNRVR